jgi:hypothetical protein
MIEYINKRMIDWAAWAKRRDDGGLGYPGSVSYCQLVQTHGEYSSGPIIEDAAAMEIERIVMALRSERQHLHAVAHWVYLAGNFTMDRVARELGCHRDTVYTRLHQLHVVVMDELHEITLAAHDRAISNDLKKNCMGRHRTA